MKNIHKIEVICGPMFSGKTEELIRRIKRLKYTGDDFIIFKPKKDDRYGEFKVSTHYQNSIKATPVDTAQEIFEHCMNNPHIKTIAIDEAQFFDKNVHHEEDNLVDVCQKLKAKGYRIIVTGLTMDFTGKPFGLIPPLLAIADEIRKLTSVCAVCKQDVATMSYKMTENEDQFELGSSDKYQARCYEHWLEGMKERIRKKKLGK